MTDGVAWQEIDPKRATRLHDVRIAAHWAAQVPASMGSLIPSVEDFSHTNLMWDSERHLMHSRAYGAGGARPFRAALRISSLSLGVIVGDLVEDEFLLRGRSLRDAQSWLKEVVREHGITKNPRRPKHDLPASDIAKSGVFEADGTSLGALEAWVANGYETLGAFAAENGSGEVRGWPHHFDIATLLELGGTGEDAKSVNIGFSPGDDAIDEPYFYVTPWPRPSDVGALPSLPGTGEWMTDGFFAAVLRGSTLPASGPEQLAATQAFLTAAFAHARKMAEG